jgi:hypothetical protein
MYAHSGVRYRGDTGQSRRTWLRRGGASIPTAEACSLSAASQFPFCRVLILALGPHFPPIESGHP